MTVLEVLILLLIAAICGAVAQAIAGFSRGGLLVAIAVGFIGALLGVWLQRQTGLPELFTIEVGGTAFPIVWSIIGGVLFAIVVGLLTSSRRLVASAHPPGTRAGKLRRGRSTRGRHFRTPQARLFPTKQHTDTVLYLRERWEHERSTLRARDDKRRVGPRRVLRRQ